MHSIEEFCQIVFDKLELNYKDYVEIDERYYRPSEVDALCGDSSKIRNQLGWSPKYSFEQLVDEMIEYDMKLARQEKLLKDHFA
jgi:GDPmannose 4,6-dehydratase